MRPIMDFLDLFENMGLGLTIVVILVVFIFLISVVGRLIPALIMGLGGLVYLFIIVLIFGIIIYFIGKFAKDLIKK